MFIRILDLFLPMLVPVLLTAGVYAYEDNNYPAVQNEQYFLEQLIAMGFDSSTLDMIIEGGGDISLENIFNQARFSDYLDRILSGRPLSPSGEIIDAQYMAGIYFNEQGILTVMVLESAFDHAGSAAAIKDMQELGIIIRTAQFTQQELETVRYTLQGMFESLMQAGVTGIGSGTIENRVLVWLDPYTEEQIEIFWKRLRDIQLDSEMISIIPAVTQEMRDFRAKAIHEATQSPCDQIVLSGEAEVSRTRISFSLENRSDYMFTYGAAWDLAYYSNGSWLPVTHLPGAGDFVWTMQAYILQSGEIREYGFDWSWRFGELEPGRYMFIRNGWLGDWSPYGNNVYAAVEFHIY